MKILLISTNAIGDAYLSMAAIEPIKKKYRDVEFYLLFPEQGKILYQDKHQNLKFIFVKKNFFSLFKTLFSLVTIKFDRIYSFFPGVFNSILLTLLRGKVKAGQINYNRIERWDNKNAKLYFRGKIAKKKEIIHEKNGNFLSRVSTIIKVTDDIDEEIKKYKPVFNQENINSINRILIHYKASIVEKSLPLNLLYDLVDLIKKNTAFDILLVGAESDFNSEIRERLSSHSIDYLINPDLQELIEAIRTSFFIGVDSFPIHIADAYNTNFLTLCSMTKSRSVLINCEKSIDFNADSFEEINPTDFVEQLCNHLIKMDIIKLMVSQN